MKGSAAALAALLLLALCSSAVAHLGESGHAVSLCLGAHPCQPGSPVLMDGTFMVGCGGLPPVLGLRLGERDSTGFLGGYGTRGWMCDGRSL